MKGARFQVGDVLDFDGFGTSYPSQWIVTEVFRDKNGIAMNVKRLDNGTKASLIDNNGDGGHHDPIKYLTKNTFLTDVHNALKQQD